ncbi:MAG: UDP-N-acetylmuramate:L-alanyl-gamma-D-glutamyl-meso-diaminopimelate ligase [Polyangiaceae bacterium]|nr:UDP-N-acetylmuramate:L-alanyl-gamma-D-glutamyl-meso-diaminopimelate ligase [Polyangiaceae bacterium]
MHIHVIAVAGTGMGSLAGLLRELGHEVTGSDVRFDPPMGPALAGWGVVCREGFSPEHLEPAPDLVVVGNVCRRDNPEVVAAQTRGLELTHIAGALQRFVFPGTAPLVVTGTHGKTTTTALTAWLLDATGFCPGFLVGGLPKNFPESFRAAPAAQRRLPLAGDEEPATNPARATPFVIEGDEYDTAFFEKTAKFLHYRAEVAIVTSIEHDHVDIYPTEVAYVEAFRRFVGELPVTGLVVANAADPRVVEVVAAHSRAPIAWYALEDQTVTVPPHWVGGAGPTGPQGTSFDLFAGGVHCGRFVTPLPGRHNLANTLAALAAAAQGFGVRLDRLRPALAAFRGVRRRQDLLGEPRGVRVYDDFAHHPTAVRETLAALRGRHPEGALFAVFEPRSATACRATHQDEYALAFDLASEVLLAPLGRAGIAAGEALDLDRLAGAIDGRGRPATAFGSVEDIVRHLAERAKPGDTIALLSNGAFGGIHELLLAALGRP